MYFTSRILYVLLMTILAAFFLTSCSGDDPVETDNGGGNVDLEVEAGISDLENELYVMINSGNIDSPEDMDFTAAQAHFAKAVKENPSNLDGQFGLGLTTLLALTSDQEINDAFREWEVYLENNTPFRGGGKSLSPLGIPLTFASGGRNLEMPLEIIAQSFVLGLQPKMEVVEPSIGNVQDIFRDRVIPALEKAASHLAVVADDPNYVFWVTPLMLGDAEEDSLELDLTEIHVARTGVLLLTSVCRLAVAYDLSFPSFDAAGIVDGLDYNNGSMLKLRADGRNQMQGVETDFLAAVGALDAGITFLLSETDSQDNDIIKTGPDDLSRNELIDILNNELSDARALFGDGLVLTEDWDGQYWTPDVALRINAHNFFDDPIEDWKKVFPPYMVTTREVTNGWVPYDNNYCCYSYTSGTAEVISGGARFWVENSYTVRDSVWGDQIYSERALYVGQMLANELRWYGESYDGTVTVSGSHQLVIGYNSLEFDVDYELVLNEPPTVIPHITLEADTFEEWKNSWGNHNLNGLLPEIGSADELFTLFGFTADDWSKEFDIDWSDLD